MLFVRSALLVLLSVSVASADGIRIEVKIDPALLKDAAPSGRLLVALAPGQGAPRYTDTGPPGGMLIGTDVNGWKPGQTVVLDKSCLFFPRESIDQIPAGEYTLQATLRTNRDLAVYDAPGNLYSRNVRARLDPKAGSTVTLTITEVRPSDKPADTATTKYFNLPSPKLTAFHGRPMVSRFAVTLPTDFAKEPDRKYGLLVNIGGFGTRYNFVRSNRPDPRFVQLHLDGCGPYGDSYQVNSANNGPLGDVLTQEIIPFVEKEFSCLGTPQSRFTAGGSTGGWVSLALQIFYPDFFNGCWSQCPDGVDFRAFELIDIYRDDNAYVNRFGFERPSKRTIDGDTMFTLRHECRIERVLGHGNRWELGGRDWASWNAAYGPRGEDGHPVPLWDGETGKINKSVLKHWEKSDLRLVAERNWETIGPKLAGGKINVWVGDADDYFLNNAVHRLKASLESRSNPPFDGHIQIDMRVRHTAGGWTRSQMLDAMAKRANLR